MSEAAVDAFPALDGIVPSVDKVKGFEEVHVFSDIDFMHVMYCFVSA